MLRTLVRIGLLAVLLAAPNGGRAQQAIDVAVGDEVGCALYDDGAVYCWGNLLGRSLTLPFSAVKIEGLPPATAISVGQYSACAATKSREAWCWGLDLQRTLRGDEPVISPAPFLVEGLPDVSAVSVGFEHQCAIGWKYGRVWCWGTNPCGELGCGDTKVHADPMRVPYVFDAFSVSTGVNNTCVVMTGGQVGCWGTDDPGGSRQGAGFVFDSPDPLEFDTEVVGRFTQVANGRNFACAIREDSGVTCWGSNIFGQLGTKTPRLGEAAVGIGEVAGLSGATDLDATFFNACAVTGGDVRCWGLMPMYVDDQDPDYLDIRIETVPGIDGATQVGVGAYFSCALDRGQVLCWGIDPEGEPDFLPGMGPDRPVPVPGLPTPPIN